MLNKIVLPTGGSGLIFMRMKWIDIAKGIGLYFVILGHLVSYGSHIFNWIFSFHMPLFFLLSGITFRYSDNFLATLKKIVLNLILPYFFIVIFCILFSLLFSEWAILSWRTTLIEVFYKVQPESLHVGQIWFLFALAVVQIIFIIIRELGIKNKMLELIVILLFPTVVLLFKYFEDRFNLPRPPFKLDTAFMALLFFYIGVVIKENNYIENLMIIQKKFRIVLIFGALLLNVCFGVILNPTINLVENSYQNPIFFLVASLTGIFAVLLLSILIKENKILEFYGKNSLAIFSFHSFYLYFFAYCISIMFSTHFSIMSNIPLYLCFLGSIFVWLLSLTIPIMYSKSIGSLVDYIKSIGTSKK